MNIKISGTIVALAVMVLPTEADEKQVPSAAQMHYLQTGIMGIVHYGLNTYVDREWGFGDTPTSVLKPTSLDPEQWVSAAKAGNLRRLVLVAKHHDGFCLFPSKYNKDYTIANTEWKGGRGDVVREFADACKKEGVEFGVYLSPWDRHQASYATPDYVDYFHNQWDELLGLYGPIYEIWLDGANGGDGWYGGAREKRSLPTTARAYYGFDLLLEKLGHRHPLAVAFNGGNKSNCVDWSRTETGMNEATCWLDNTGVFLPVEADTPMRKGGWFWHPLDRPKSLAELVEVYFMTVGRNSILNLGLAPNRAGLIGEDDIRRLQEFGDYIRRFEATDRALGGRAEDSCQERTLCRILKLPEKRRFNAVDFGEDLSKGQRVATWRVECFVSEEWQQVASGTTIGYRRIERFGEVVSDKLRLTFHGRNAVPQIRQVSLRVAPTVAGEESDDFEQWRSPCKVVETEPGLLEFDFLRRVAVNAIQYVPPRNRTVHVPDKFFIDVSDDGKSWHRVMDGEFGNLRANPVRRRQMIPGGVQMRFARVRATSALEGEPSWEDAPFEFYTEKDGDTK